MTGRDTPDQRKDGRSEWRAQMGVEVELRAGTPRWRKVRMTDLSVHGFRASGSGGLSVGQRVLLRFAGLSPLAAEIRWLAEQEMGCNFVQPLSPYVFDHIVRQLQAAQGPG